MLQFQKAQSKWDRSHLANTNAERPRDYTQFTTTTSSGKSIIRQEECSSHNKHDFGMPITIQLAQPNEIIIRLSFDVQASRSLCSKPSKYA
jgi:hypothetical protein